VSVPDNFYLMSVDDKIRILDKIIEGVNQKNQSLNLAKGEFDY
jgi:hypothetical protein